MLPIVLTVLKENEMTENELKAWVEFFASVFEYTLDPTELHIGIRPDHECVPIVVPKKEMSSGLYRKWPHSSQYPPPEAPMTTVYKVALEIFPYTRRTPQPQDYWNGSNFFGDIVDNCTRPSRPYVVWIKIPDIRANVEWVKEWEQIWATPGPTLEEQMMLDLFWWHQHKVPFGKNMHEGWKSADWARGWGVLCKGSRFREGCGKEKQRNDNPSFKYFGHKPTYLIPMTGWGEGGWRVSYGGYKDAIATMIPPCLVSF